MMSDMKTFTVRELDRQPAAVLDACERDGSARVRRRDGRTYRIEPEHKLQVIGELPDFAARRRRIFRKPFSAEQAARFDKLVAGE